MDEAATSQPDRPAHASTDIATPPTLLAGSSSFSGKLHMSAVMELRLLLLMLPLVLLRQSEKALASLSVP
jgi:hypothetical protein